MTSKFIQKSFKETNTAIKTFEKGVEVLAGIRILQQKTTLNFETETARIERCIEFFYKTQDFDEDFYEFGNNFIKELGREIVYSGQYEDLYLSDVENIAA